ncbi:MAG: hypothetical protein IJK06_12905 [Clostridia bacterium]|nr:hypothetical protein [Clostridia bacterium]
MEKEYDFSDAKLNPYIMELELQKKMDAAASWANEVGLTEEDVSSAVKAVRNRKKKQD